METPRPPAAAPRSLVRGGGPDAGPPPRRFTWRRQDYRVVAGDGPERIHGEWWRNGREMWAVRDYFRVETQDGMRFWLFRRGTASTR
ncbi:DUF6504 family protein [Novosphingobium panipatense]|uniref:DUF6504 family protein n=1 Tax=Novosphingobium panipatense TaxID=428991 RepID=UPI003610F6FC